MCVCFHVCTYTVLHMGPRPLMQINILLLLLLLYGVCVGGEICHRGGRFAIWYYSLLGKFCHRISSGGRFAIRYSFMGNVCHIGSFSRGQSAMVFVPLSRNVCVCVGGGGVIYHRGGSFTIIMVLFLPCGSSAM